MMSQSLLANKYVRIGLVAIVLLGLLLILLAPATGQQTSGSTFNPGPEGYRGWYEYMEEQGVSIQRWRRPVDELGAEEASAPQTLLRVYPGLRQSYIDLSSSWIDDWTAAGNSLIILGLDASITEAPFTTQQASPQGDVVIQTRKRHLSSDPDELLADDHGATVWQRNWQGGAAGEGAIYAAVTPHLAANAYRDEPGNYAFLADLVNRGSGPIWVDEYLHGYKAADVIVEQVASNWGAYLAKTPVKIAVIQILIGLGIVLLAQNWRLGNLRVLRASRVDNSQAYIEALAAVLHKAASTPFLIDMITKAERSRLQKSLGFHKAQVDDGALRAAWSQQTGRPAQVIDPLINPRKQVAPKADARLKRWLIQLAQIRRTPLQ